MVVIEPPKGTEPSPEVKRLVEMAETVCLDPAKDTELVYEIAELTSEAIKMLATFDDPQILWFAFLTSRNIEEFNPRYNAVMAAASYIVQEVLNHE